MARPSPRNRLHGVNVPPLERVASGALGLALAAYGLRGRGVVRALALGAGVAAIARGVSGRCPYYRSRVIRDGIHVHRSETILAAPGDVYQVWRDLANLPRFMTHVSAVEVEDARTSRWWVQEGPFALSWRAELVEDDPGRRLRWRSLPGSDIWHEGAIELRPAPGDRGTVIGVELTYRPIGGLIAAALLHGFLHRVTYDQLGEELARLRQLVETGELATAARRPERLDARDKAMTASELVHDVPSAAGAVAAAAAAGREV